MRGTAEGSLHAATGKDVALFQQHAGLNERCLAQRARPSWFMIEIHAVCGLRLFSIRRHLFDTVGEARVARVGIGV
eukprot:m.475271 g.475271  ORF g.475271 m.475271 type:complete len:76 (-) comp38014_c0_seq1:63-290(-)